MTWLAIKGKYENGVVKPSKQLSAREGQDVLIFFTAPDAPSSVSVWQDFKNGVAEAMPDLLLMTDDEAKAEFDKLSDKVAENLPFETVEEFEQAMRGDKYGLARY